MLASLINPPNRTERERLRQAEQQRQRAELPDSVRSWVQSLERDAQKQIATIRKAAAQQQQPLQAQASDVQAVIDRMQAEFDAAQAWLSAIPAKAEPAHVTQYLTTKTLWPQRIQAQRDKLASVRQQLAELQRVENRQVNDVRVAVQLEIGELARRLPLLDITLE